MVCHFIAKMKLAIHKKYLSVEVDLNTEVLHILWLLYKEGYISGFFIKKTSIEVFLKYIDGKSTFVDFKQISKISKRVYIKDLETIKYKHGIKYLLSTDKGLRITNGGMYKGEIVIKFR